MSPLLAARILFLVLIASGLLHGAGALRLAGLYPPSAHRKIGPALVWAATLLILVAAALALKTGLFGWQLYAIIGVILSQSLVTIYWKDSLPGIIVNGLILLLIIQI